MKTTLTRIALGGLLLLSGAGVRAAEAALAPGAGAPDFTLTDIQGKEHSLSGYKGKYVILEWTNYDCPFVKKHYGAGNMQALQKKAAADGAVWLSVCSSAPGKQGHFSLDEWKERSSAQKAAAAAILLDPDGKVGRLYDAKTTPHLFLISPEGVLLYMGGIDDKPSADPADIPGATNYLTQALEQAKAGKPVEPAATKPYGCSVKY
jgi:peroxiredoxin